MLNATGFTLPRLKTTLISRHRGGSTGWERKNLLQTSSDKKILRMCAGFGVMGPQGPNRLRNSSLWVNPCLCTKSPWALGLTLQPCVGVLLPPTPAPCQALRYKSVCACATPWPTRELQPGFLKNKRATTTHRKGHTVFLMAVLPGESQPGRVPHSDFKEGDD